MTEGKFSKDFWAATISSMLIGGYAIMLLTITLMYGNSIGCSAFIAGMLSSVFAFASLGSRCASGFLCDHFSSRTVLLIGAAVYVITPIPFIMNSSIAVLMATRIVQGLAMGVASTAAAAMATARIPRDRFSEGIGYFGIGMSACSAIAPGVGLAIYRRFDYVGVFIFSIVISIAVIILTLPVKDPGSGEVPREADKPAVKESLWSKLFESTALFAAAITLIISIAQVTIMQFLEYHMNFYGFATTGLFYPLSAVVIILAKIFWKKIIRFSTEKGIAVLGLSLIALTYTGLHFLYPSSLIIVILALIYGIGHSVSNTALNTIAIAKAPANRLGAANSTYLAANDIGYAIGPVIWNGYCEKNGYGNFYILAAVLLLAAILIMLIPRHKKMLECS